MCKLGVISQEWLKIEVHLLWSANRKSYMPHQLAQQRLTLSDLEWPFHASQTISELLYNGIRCGHQLKLLAAAAADSNNNKNCGRLVEEIRAECGGLKMEADNVYMATVFSEFIQTVVLLSRGVSLKPPFTYDAVSVIFIRFCLPLYHDYH